MVSVSGIYPKYEVYKEVHAIGPVPSHWNEKRLKFLVTYNDDVLDDSCDPDMPIRYVDISSVDRNRGIVKVEEMAFQRAPSRARRIVKRGDTIVSTVRTYLKAITRIDDEAHGYIVSTGFAVLRPKEKELDPHFLGYIMNDERLIGDIVANSNGVSYPAINPSALVGLNVFQPPLSEQRAIAAFLDQKTSQLDELIEKKEKLLSLLVEKRTAIIRQAVTKGLDPDVKMKDSGIEWLGDVPEHWVILKASHGFRQIGSGTTPKSDKAEFYNGTIPWVTTSELREGVIVDTQTKVTDYALKELGLKIYPAGSIAIAMYGATIGRLGILGVDATVNQACCVFSKPRKFTPKFFYYWLWMSRNNLISLSSGGGQPNLSQDDLKKLRIPAPTIEEQELISDYLDKNIQNIIRAEKKLTKSIGLLKEYRIALITAAVTGQIDVRKPMPA